MFENDQQEPDQQELNGADSVIAVLQKTGHGDYSAFRREIALDIYTNGHYSGNTDVIFEPQDYDETSTLQGFRVIQEDEYDQHMDNDEDAPSHDEMLGDVHNGYLWIN